ncbi:MAG TPA: hypothetical protein VKR43_00890 [Bryobacteraceae bacterium]|jgi:hypothetical protein|nr:hypothetical protein [Bryobacteraceae bacterium]
MRVWLAAIPAIICVLSGCGDSPPVETKAKAPEKPPEALTGRQAFQQTYPSARTWAADCQPIRMRSMNLPNPKSENGKAGAWQIDYVSETRRRQRSFTWSAIEAGGSLHKGVFGTQEEAWGGAQGQEQPFLAAALKIDTPEAWVTAIGKSGEYLNKPGAKPRVNFMLTLTSRYPDPAWRVFWGESVSAAEWSVFVDATTGAYLGR